MDDSKIIKVAPDLHKRLKMLALRKSMTLQSFVSAILTAAVTTSLKIKGDNDSLWQ